jgi:hypothetical protein
VIGEAARHVPTEIQASASDVPWADMCDMRNIVAQSGAQPFASARRCGYTQGMATRKKKSADLTVRLTDEQRAELDAAAEAEELDTSTWLRQLGLLEARARRGAPKRLRRVREAMRRLDEGRE